MAGPISILEVGCGDGGNLLHFAKRGYEVVGVDISANRINDAKSFFEQENANAKFICSDILKLNGYKSYFDLVICHDVIEHIGNKQEMLSRIECFLKPKGLLFIGFPAWQMPFGGHQQICHSKLLSITPFFHMLPQCLYKYILSLGGENVECINELLSIKSTKITIELFEKIVAQTSFDIVDRRLYFVNPHYEVKFGLKPRRLLKPLSEMPYVISSQQAVFTYLKNHLQWILHHRTLADLCNKPQQILKSFLSQLRGRLSSSFRIEFMMSFHDAPSRSKDRMWL